MFRTLAKKIKRRKNHLYQFGHAFYRGDCLGQLGIHLDTMYRREGLIPHLVSCEYDTSFSADFISLERFNPSLHQDDTAILHYTMDSPVNRLVQRLHCQKQFYYHNVTPPEYFKNYDDALYNATRIARIQLPEYARSFDRVITDSHFNARDLERAGFREVEVCPLPFDRSRLDIPADRQVYKKYNDGHINILFVGRIVPNKNYTLLIKTFKRFQQLHPKSRLLLPGDPLPAYQSELAQIISEENAANVVFFGRIPQAQLNALYRAADIFLCLSLHEGYCLPLIEAMYFSLPIIALDTGAVAETVADGGRILHTHDPDIIAREIRLLLDNRERRECLRHNQQKLLRARYNIHTLQGHTKHEE